MVGLSVKFTEKCPNCSIADVADEELIGENMNLKFGDDINIGAIGNTI